MFHAHLIEREAAEVEAGAPETSGDCASAIAEEGGARAQCYVVGHAYLYCRTGGTGRRRWVAPAGKGLFFEEGKLFVRELLWRFARIVEDGSSAD